MLTMTDRLTRYFLKRLRRAAIQEAYEAAAEAGLLVSNTSTPGTTRWEIANMGPILTGDAATDGARIDRILAHHRRGQTVRHLARGPEIGQANLESIYLYEGVQSMPKGAVARRRAMAEAAGDRGGRSTADLLAHLRRRLGRPRVMDVATALLTARAIGETITDSTLLFASLARPDAFVLIKVPAQGFERRIGEMLELGLIMPFKMFQIDGGGNYALSGRYRETPDADSAAARAIVTFSGEALSRMGDDEVRDRLRKAILERKLPIVLADETVPAPSPRVATTADVVFETNGIDRLVIIELLEICLGIAPRHTIAAFNEKNYVPERLGIDDLVLAVRPGRGLNQILRTLQSLDEHNRSTEEREREASGKGSADKSKGSANEALKRKLAPASIDLVQPQDSPTEGEGGSQAHKSSGYLSVETLAGYGPAKEWALNLKADLGLWQAGSIEWSQLSTKILLSGPPGTGKTTWARALCNTLGLPLLVTSVARWLEPGYLGDVLKQMSSVFEAAREQGPAIVFIDEIDNIGKRAQGAKNENDYWNSIVNRLLELLDGVQKSDGVIIVAATNRPEVIDEALLRSGRLETHFVIGKPDVDALTDILIHHLGANLDNVLDTAPSSLPEAEENLLEEADNPAPSGSFELVANMDEATRKPATKRNAKNV